MPDCACKREGVFTSLREGVFTSLREGVFGILDPGVPDSPDPGVPDSPDPGVPGGAPLYLEVPHCTWRCHIKHGGATFCRKYPERRGGTAVGGNLAVSESNSRFGKPPTYSSRCRVGFHPSG